MTEETFDFILDTSEKAKTARSAHYKNGRSSAKTFNNYTNAEIKAKNGPVLSYSKPILFSRLIEFSPSMQRDYILYLTDTYHVPSIELSKMLGISTKKLWNHLNSIGITSYDVTEDFDKEGWILFMNVDTFPHRHIDWEEFKALESEQQKDYISWLTATYSPTRKELSKMFGAKVGAISNYFSTRDIHTNKNYHRDAKKIKEFSEFIGEKPSEETATDLIASDEDLDSKEEKTIEKDTKTEAPMKRKIPASLNLTFCDETSIDDIAETLKLILGDVVNGKVEIYINNK